MKKYILLISSVFIAFVFSAYAGNSIFISFTPNINPNYLTNLQNQFKKNIDSIYLALSNININNTKKDIAVVYPTLKPRGNFIFNSDSKPTITKTPEETNFAKIDPATIPANFFKSISKGVSAYERNEGTIFKIDDGTSYFVEQLELPNGKVVDVVHFDGE